MSLDSSSFASPKETVHSKKSKQQTQQIQQQQQQQFSFTEEYLLASPIVLNNNNNNRKTLNQSINQTTAAATTTKTPHQLQLDADQLKHFQKIQNDHQHSLNLARNVPETNENSHMFAPVVMLLNSTSQNQHHHNPKRRQREEEQKSKTKDSTNRKSKKKKIVIDDDEDDDDSVIIIEKENENENGILSFLPKDVAIFCRNLSVLKEKENSSSSETKNLLLSKMKMIPHSTTLEPIRIKAICSFCGRQAKYSDRRILKDWIQCQSTSEKFISSLKKKVEQENEEKSDDDDDENQSCSSSSSSSSVIELDTEIDLASCACCGSKKGAKLKSLCKQCVLDIVDDPRHYRSVQDWVEIRKRMMAMAVLDQ
jgi:hypothetical protein